MGKDMKRPVAAAIASLGWFALGLQLYLNVSGAVARGTPISDAIVTYFSFFTILTNLLIALCLTLVAWRPGQEAFWNRPAIQCALVLYIIVVAIVYAAVLQNLWSPRGLQLVADRLLHDVLPVLYVGYWLVLTPKRATRLTDTLWWQLYPLVYMAYTLAHGASTGFYPYPFLNVAKHGYKDVLSNGLLLLVLLLTLGVLLVILDRLLGSLQTRWNSQSRAA
jgi:hypothetical protein